MPSADQSRRSLPRERTGTVVRVLVPSRCCKLALDVEAPIDHYELVVYNSRKQLCTAHGVRACVPASAVSMNIFTRGAVSQRR